MEKTESAEKPLPVASVKSPSRDAHLRNGEGFSLAEIKKAGQSIALLKELKIKIDYFRKSAHKWNIEQLKALKPPKIRKGKKNPYLSKEERMKARAKRMKKVVLAKKEEIVPDLEEELFYEADDVEVTPQKTIKKAKISPKTKPKPAVKPKVKTPTKTELKPADKPKVKTTEKTEPIPKVKVKTPTEPKEKEIPLTKLSGLGSATAKKFEELGVSTIKDLLGEDPEELSVLISGVSVDRIKKWVAEGKELLNK